MPNHRRKLPRIEWGASIVQAKYRPGDDLVLAGVTHARAAGAAATSFDATGLMVSAPTGVLRDNHWIDGVRHTLLEDESTQRLTRSAEFDHAAWTKDADVSVTPNVALAPDGTLTADLLTKTGAVTSRFLTQAVIFTDDGEKSALVYLRAGTAAFTDVLLYDLTAGGSRHLVRVTWGAGGVPTLTTLAGSGVRFTPRYRAATGLWEIAFSATGIVAANTNGFYIYPAGSGTESGTVYCGGAQVENRTVPTSYMVSGATTVTRAADDFYFTVPFFTGPVQAFTAFLDTVELMHPAVAQSTNRATFFIGAAGGGAEARAYIYQGFSSAGYAGAYDPGTASVTGAAGTGVVRGDRAEHLLDVTAVGVARYSMAVNGGAEQVATPGAASSTPIPWAGSRVYLNTFGGVAGGAIAVRSFVLASGSLGFARARALAGAGATAFGTALTFGYPLDAAVSYSRPAEGSEMVFLPSGEADAWDAGTAHLLEGLARWIPRENTATPLATGWDGATGWRTFLEHARRGNPFWFCPDSTDLSTGWTLRLEAPFDDAPALEPDMTREVSLRMRGVSAIEGY